MIGDPTYLIVGHQHDRAYRHRYPTPDCRACGQPVRAHESWGKGVAAKIGGNWLDYVDTTGVTR